MTEVQRRAIREARATGVSLRELGRQFGVSHETIRLNLAGDDPKPWKAKKPAIGDTNGRLTVIAEAGSKNGQRLVLCRCQCGKEKVIAATRLRPGLTQSCGCLVRDKAGKRVMVTLKGRTQHLAAWCDELGIPMSTVQLRKRLGWNREEALTVPPLARRNTARGSRSGTAQLDEWGACGIMALLLMGHAQREVDRWHGKGARSCQIWSRRAWRWLFEEEAA